MEKFSSCPSTGSCPAAAAAFFGALGTTGATFAFSYADAYAAGSYIVSHIHFAKGRSYLLESRENHLELLVLLLDGLLQSSDCLSLGSSHLFRGTLLGGDSLGDTGIEVDEGL